LKHPASYSVTGFMDGDELGGTCSL
jgi:hypothetical protein